MYQFKGNEITSTVVFLDVDYFFYFREIDSPKRLLDIAAAIYSQAWEYLIVHKVNIKSEKRSDLRKIIQDVELNGLPSLRSLQKTLLEIPSEWSQNLITIEQDAASGEPSLSDLKV